MTAPHPVAGQRYGTRLVLEVRSCYYSPSSRHAGSPSPYGGTRGAALWVHLRCDCGRVVWSTRPAAACRACRPPPRTHRTVSVAEAPASGHMQPGAGDRDAECARYDACLDGVARAHGDAWHCPSGCAERVAVPREYHRAVATMRRYLPVYPASGWGE